MWISGLKTLGNAALPDDRRGDTGVTLLDFDRQRKVKAHIAAIMRGSCQP